MHITDTPLKFIAGILAQPQAGSPRPIDPALPAKGAAQHPPAGRRSAAAAASNLLRLGGAESLDQAVRTWRAEGRLPPRGSLLDISA